MSTHVRTRLVTRYAAAAALLAAVSATPAARAATNQPQAGERPSFPIVLSLPKPVSIAKCLAEDQVRCYTPVQLRTAYDLGPLYDRGITGRGGTIVIAVPFGSPTVRHDLKVFDARWGIPSSPLKIVKFGKIPPYNPKSPTRIDWAAGTTLQVEYTHAIAPGAKIVVAETGVSETTGVHGFPELMDAERSLINAGTGDVIEQITGAPEATFPGFHHHNYSSLQKLRFAFQDAAAHHVTEIAAAGDFGTAGFTGSGKPIASPVTNWPASDPLVTAVGATHIALNSAGTRLKPDTVWNDGSSGASGGGLSTVFPRPAYQSDVSSVVASHRGVPDISVSGAVSTSSWVYTSFGGFGSHPGWSLFNGTAQASSMFAGIVALADQVAGHRLGLINPALYRLGALGQHPDRTGLVDVTKGYNGFDGVPGYHAGPGYDLASGWGTIDAAKFVPALARAARHCR